MNKEKLINIILKDIEELKDISEEIKKDNPSQKLETDIALSKATIILQEFQLLKEKYILENFHQPVIEIQKNFVSAETKVEEKAQEEPAIPATPNVLHEEEQVPEEYVPEPMIIIDEEAVEDDDTEDDDFEVSETEHQLVEMIESDEEEEDEQVQDEDEIEEESDFDENEDKDEENEEENSFEEEDEFEDEDDFEEEDEEIAPPPFEKRTVGENFHSEMSLNDRLENNNTLDQKISHSPISSLQSAIGINDRFLFIREVFNNDSTLYATAIKRIDGCANIKEAVDYLSSNFKIKKTETSLKFVELIKRRFAK